MRYATRFSLLAALTGASLTYLAAADDGSRADQKPAKKADHPSAAVVRDRLLIAFHGQTAHDFTTIPGFGRGRMLTLYKRVPWEIPHFSTPEIEAASGPTPPVLKEVFAKSVDTFQKLKDAPPNAKAPAVGFGGHIDGAVSGGLQLRLLDLVGVTDPDHPRVASGGRAFELIREIGHDDLPAAVADRFNPKTDERLKLETRPLDFFETAGLVELTAGKETYVRSKDQVVRMLGALRATDKCLKCHTDKERGDLLGAFSYVFVDTAGTLTKKLREK